MNALWTSRECETATLGSVTQDFDVSGLSIDTRTLKPGDMFVALKGESRDGHAFVEAAFTAKAFAALVSHVSDAIADKPLLVVANTQRALEDLARASRARTNAKIVAVTGSAGKTTTKEMLRLALGALGETAASAASYNNQWGVPLSLALMPKNAKYGVFEIGMNHFGEIRALVSFARPHIAVITTIAPAHLEFFGSCEAIADAKSEVFEGLLPGGIGVLPADSPYVDRLRARARQAGVSRLLMFGEKEGSDARLREMVAHGEGMKVTADILGRSHAFHIGATGRHIAGNAVAALLVVAALGGDVPNAAAALSGFAALKGRGARFDLSLPKGRVQVIDESYNANPASMSAALALLGSTTPTTGGRRVAVLGDMLEMGPQAGAFHAALSRDIERAHVDAVFACGTQMAALWDALPPSRRGAYGATSADIAAKIPGALHAGDVVLIKGSLGSRMALIIDALRAQAG